jgi:hypothetical protein
LNLLQWAFGLFLIALKRIPKSQKIMQYVSAAKPTAPAKSPAEKEAGVRPEQPENEEEPEEAKA